MWNLLIRNKFNPYTFQSKLLYLGNGDRARRLGETTTPHMNKAAKEILRVSKYARPP